MGEDDFKVETREVIPAAWKREKNRILDKMYAVDDALDAVREVGGEAKWRDFLSKVVSGFKRLRTKMVAIAKTKRPKYIPLNELKDYFFCIDNVPMTQENLEKWGKFSVLLDDLAEDAGITKVSVEDETNPEDAWEKGLR